MKALVVGDLHAKETSPFPWNNVSVGKITRELWRAVRTLRFVREKAEEENVDAVILLGDVFHRVENSHRVLGVIGEELREIARDFRVIALTGNHDIIGDISAVTSLPVHHAITSPQTIEGWGFLPYIHSLEELKRAIHEIDASIVFVHNTVSPAWLTTAYKEDVFIPLDGKRVIAGHVHIPQGGVKDEVIYVGTPYQNALNEAPKEIPFRVLVIDGKEHIKQIPTPFKPAIKVREEEFNALISLNAWEQFEGFVVESSNPEKVLKVVKELGINAVVRKKRNLTKSTPKSALLVEFDAERFIRQTIKETLGEYALELFTAVVNAKEGK